MLSEGELAAIVATLESPTDRASCTLPVRSLYCCCCGAWTRGRQWPNRDTGYGLCPRCGDWIPNRRPDHEDSATPEEMVRLYGIRGVHWDVAEPEEIR